MIKKCCFSGTLSEEDYLQTETNVIFLTRGNRVPFNNLADKKIKKEIENAVKDGYNTFVVQYGMTIDKLSLNALLEMKKKNKNIKIEAVFPNNPYFYEDIQDKADEIRLVDDNDNSFVYEECQRLIVVTNVRGLGVASFSIDYTPNDIADRPNKIF